MSDWIKCSDRLPEAAMADPDCSDNVLAYQIHVGHQMLQAFYSQDDQLWYDQAGDQLDGEVTHWQPLPAPPTE